VFKVVKLNYHVAGIHFVLAQGYRIRQRLAEDLQAAGLTVWYDLSGQGISSNNMAELDNVKIWDLDQVPGLADHLK
jgi:hypothetical protein